LKQASCFTDPIDLLLDRELTKRSEWERKKEPDAAVEHDESIAKGARNLFGRAFYGRRIRNAPMSCHRLSRPKGAGLVGGVMADSEYEVQVGRARSGELVP